HSYPKAKEALIEVRDRGVNAFAQRRGYPSLFQEISSINDYLPDRDATITLFKKTDAINPLLARQCYPAAEKVLVAAGEYELCLKYFGDYKTAFATTQQLRKMGQQTTRGFPQMLQIMDT